MDTLLHRGLVIKASLNQGLVFGQLEPKVVLFILAFNPVWRKRVNQMGLFLAGCENPEFTASEQPFCFGEEVFIFKRLRSGVFNPKDYPDHPWSRLNLHYKQWKRAGGLRFPVALMTKGNLLEPL